MNIVNPETCNELLIVVVFNVVDPGMFNVENIVSLFEVKLYEVTSYIPELFTF